MSAIVEPRTDAGRELLAQIKGRNPWRLGEDAIAMSAFVFAIEAEARADAIPEGFLLVQGSTLRERDRQLLALREALERLHRQAHLTKGDGYSVRFEGPNCEYAAVLSDIDSAAKEYEARIRADAVKQVLADIEALPRWDKRTVPGGFHVNLAAIRSLLDHTGEGETERKRKS